VGENCLELESNDFLATAVSGSPVLIARPRSGACYWDAFTGVAERARLILLRWTPRFRRTDTTVTALLRRDPCHVAHNFWARAFGMMWRLDNFAAELGLSSRIHSRSRRARNRHSQMSVTQQRQSLSSLSRSTSRRLDPRCVLIIF